MQADGIEVTSLCVGEPDFPPSHVILEAACRAVLEGDTKYTAVTGTLALRQAIAKDLHERKRLSYNPQTDIVVGNGAKQSVYQSVLATSGAGDKVIVPAPYWPSYPEMVLLAGAEPIIVQTSPDMGYLMTGEQLRKALQEHPETKLLILCNPSNPTGGVYSKAQLDELSSVLQDYPQVMVLADEIYEQLTYDVECFSFAAQPGMFDRTLTVNGFSKAYAMTGFRLGYVAAPPKLSKAITTIQSQLTSCASSVSQAAGVAAFQVTANEMAENRAIMKEKRDYVLKELNSMPHVHVHVPPQGAFYVMPDISYYCRRGGDDVDFCRTLLNEYRVAVVPGSSFGAPGTIRISYATSMGDLEYAMNQLRSMLDNVGFDDKPIR